MITISPTDLSKKFTTRLKAEIGWQNLNKVARLNRAENDPNICHSHDFCDANMVMLEAMKDLGFDEKDLDLEDEGQCRLMNEAWDQAKALWQEAVAVGRNAGWLK